MKKRKEGKMSDDLIKHCMCGCIYLEVECPNCNKVTDADRIEELEAALLELIDHTHNCEKELTEELHHQDFCGESLPLTKARATLAELKGQGNE
jgi:predicted small metal-binding protein